MAEHDVVVVGAGIAGLTAARDLAMGGLSVLLLESSERVGGKVSGHTVAGVELDAGAESFATRGDTVAALIRELGLADQLADPNPVGAWLYRADGSAHPLPRTGMLGIPGTPMATDVIEIVGLAGSLRAQLDALIPGVVGARETRLGPLVRRRMGRRVLDRLVAPVVSGVHSQHPDDLEADRVAPGLRAALRKNDSLAKAVLALRAAAPAGTSVGGIRGGIHRLAAELHRDVAAFGGETRFGCTVRSVDADGVTTATGERIGSRRTVFTSATVTGGSPIVLATMMLDLPALDSAPRGTGLLVESGSTTVTAKALTHGTAKWGWLAEAAGEHRHVLRLSYDATRLDSGDLAERARMDAQALLGVQIPAGAVEGFARVEWSSSPTAVPVPDGVVAIGESVAGTGLAAVVAQARREAGGLLSELAGRPTGPEDD
ncbi:MAG TPA: FAD-dependent oxidoreductase [Homoserinimonas sp.]|nr:FAD-dependent oxidoreductase [Homoserinimonas sp.]